MNDLIKSKRLYMLFALPFLAVAIAFVSENLSTSLVENVHIKGLINLDFMTQLDSFWLSVICFCVVLCVAYLIFLTNERFKLLQQTTTLPSLIYVLLTSGVIIKLGVDSLLLAVLILAIAIDRFQIAINDIKSNKALFDFGFVVALAVVIYPKFLLLIVWSLCLPFFSGRTTLKDLLALLYGLLLPALFLLFYYFWTDSIGNGLEIFTHNLLQGEYVAKLSMIEWGRLGILLLLLLISLYHISARYSILVVNRRRGLVTYISLLFFLTVSLLVIPRNNDVFVYVIALPLSMIYSQFFLSNRSVVFGNIMFVLLLCACFITYLM